MIQVQIRIENEKLHFKFQQRSHLKYFKTNFKNSYTALKRTADEYIFVFTLLKSKLKVQQNGKDRKSFYSESVYSYQFIFIRISMLQRLCIFPTESLEPRIRTDMKQLSLATYREVNRKFIKTVNLPNSLSISSA